MCILCNASKDYVIRKGFYRRNVGKSTRVQRYLCKKCGRYFSDQTGSLTYREHKPQFNQIILRMLVRGMSQRAIADLLALHETTVARKMVRLSLFANRLREIELKSHTGVDHLVFDDMETFEHTKCKPLSIALAVDEITRKVLSVRTSQMPAKGHLAKISRKKYGKRQDKRDLGWNQMMQEVRKFAPKLCTIKSDKNPHYPKHCRRAFPDAIHITYEGRGARVTGQGELKKGGFDPLFALNHTAAMFRDNLKCLTRKTWCTTKLPERLQSRLELYAFAHNHRIKHKDKPRKGRRVRMEAGAVKCIS